MMPAPSGADRYAVFEGVRSCIADVLEVEPSDVSIGSRFEEDLSANSLTLIEVMMAIEETFGVEVGESDVGGVLTVADACAVVTRLLERSSE